jgi:hypothetical protein
MAEKRRAADVAPALPAALGMALRIMALRIKE